MEGNQVLLGTHGKVWFDGELFANVKSFEAKLTGTFEDVAISGQLGTDSKYTGYSIEGTMTLHKVDSKVAKMCANGFVTGNVPTFTVIASTDDPQAQGMEKVELSGVHITEMMLHKFEVGTVGEEEVPFRAKAFRYLEEI